MYSCLYHCYYCFIRLQFVPLTCYCGYVILKFFLFGKLVKNATRNLNFSFSVLHIVSDCRHSQICTVKFILSRNKLVAAPIPLHSQYLLRTGETHCLLLLLAFFLIFCDQVHQRKRRVTLSTGCHSEKLYRPISRRKQRRNYRVIIRRNTNSCGLSFGLN